MDEDKEQKQPEVQAKDRPVDPEREAKIAAAKAMAAKVAAARAAAASPPPAAAAPAPGAPALPGRPPASVPAGKDRPADPEREAKIAAAKAMAAKVAASRAAAGGQAPATPAAAAGAAPRATATVSRPAAPAVSGQTARAAAAEAGRSAFRDEDPNVVSRRYVLRWLLWGSVVAWFGLAAGAGVAMFYPNKVTGFGGIIASGASTSQVPVNFRPPVTVVEAHAYLVNPGPGILALWWKCVHLGCTVPWVPSEDHFHCPCHGSVYLYDSQRIAGPAPRSLDLFPVMIDKSDNIWINTNPGLVYQHLSYEASLCTPLTKNDGKWSWAKGHTL